ncbi:hypothetical protein BH11MYX1_BH11MYX1_47070 [soil metagenome]
MKALACAAAIATGWACGSAKSSTLTITVTDRGQLIAARVVLLHDGEPVHLGTIDLYGQRQGATACAIAPGVIGTWDGIVLAEGRGTLSVGSQACAIVPGTYTVWAWHGFDYERWEGRVTLRDGDVTLEIPLARAWTPPPNVVAADMHVHAEASPDSGMPNTQRVAAQLAAGIQVIGLANHNTSGDANAAIQQLGVGSKIASVPSNEITSEMMHVGIYPAITAPSADQIVKADPETLFQLLRALPDHPIIQVNHPRFRYQSLFDTTKWDGVSWPPPFPLEFDAMEVVAGYSANNTAGDRRLDDELRDFYTFYRHGFALAAMGGSDTHDFNWVLDGAARTFVTLPGAYDQAAFIQAIRDRRTVATSGPWLDVRASAKNAGPSAGPGQLLAASGSVTITVTCSHAAFVQPARIRIIVGSTTTELAVSA